MDGQDDPLAFGTGPVVFEPCTGYVGTGALSMPEPITSMVLNGYVQQAPGGRVVEGYWLRVSDETGMVPDPQPVMHSWDFGQVTRVMAALFSRCSEPGETRVGFDFTAYHNELARRLDPTLTDQPVGGLSCSVTGYGDRSFLLRFSTCGAEPSDIAAIRGRMTNAALHALASGFRDMVSWRADTLAVARERAAEATASRRKGADPERRAALAERKATIVAAGLEAVGLRR